MIDVAKQIVVLGSTGSIGTSAAEVIAAGSGRLQAFALSAHGRFDRQAHERSLELWLDQHRKALALAAGSLAAVTIGAAIRSRRRTPR